MLCSAGSQYGNGCYLATTFGAAAQSRYSRDNSTTVIICDVVKGSITEGYQGLKETVTKDGRDFDTAVDSIYNPSMLIVFDTKRILPKYLVQLRKADLVVTTHQGN
jgi:hypothetical protein